MEAHHLTRNERKGLWAVLWRVLVFGPIVMPIGLAVLLSVVALALAPIGYAFSLMLSGHLFWGCLLAVLWAEVLWLARSVFRWMFDGIEYAM